jgi:hypothetical protein
MISTRAARSVVVVSAAALGFAACEHASNPVSPDAASIGAPVSQILPSIPAPVPYPASAAVPAQAILCKDASSPLGSYSFTISATNRQPGDQVASSATLSPGECALIYNQPSSVNLAFTSITITEVIPAGATYSLNHVSVTDREGGRDEAGPSVTLHVNGWHGGLANYYNQGILAAGVQAGEVRLCKSGQVAGTFDFLVTAVGTIASDQIKNTVTLASGSCATVFLRTEAGPVAATVVVRETIAATADTHLEGVTVDGQAAATVGAAVTVQQNLEPGKLVVFINANGAAQIGIN